jgi:CheY-like chemotaxis protein
MDRGPPRGARASRARLRPAIAEEEAAVPGFPSAALTGRRVLVVEDEFLIALDLSSILDGLGCVTLGPSPTVAEALRLLAVGRPDAALLDLNLRGTCTTPVALALAAGGVPFAVVTAYGRAPGPAFDGAPLVAKPFQAEGIRGALLALPRPWRLEGGRYPTGASSSPSYCRRTVP